jgi:hypothetical protein
LVGDARFNNTEIQPTGVTSGPRACRNKKPPVARLLAYLVDDDWNVGERAFIACRYAVKTVKNLINPIHYLDLNRRELLPVRHQFSKPICLVLLEKKYWLVM